MEDEKNLSSSSVYKLVPWSSWEQWNFVREAIFSSSPHSVSSALKKISAWRSRGCLPIPIDVTAAFIEIQQQDPFFRKDLENNTIVSEEMLAMLYSMAIMRLVNGFMEHAHKKTGRSISELAEAVGIPRMLVDIRHESSHRDLPSIKLVRSASIKALDWLKSNYWEPQKNEIPDICVEIRSKLREIIYYIKAKEIKSENKRRRARRTDLDTESKSSSKSKSIEKKITKATKAIINLYSSNPSEVVSVLLELFQMNGLDSSDPADVAQPDESDSDGLQPLKVSFNDMKSIITKLSNKKPRFVLTLLNSVLQIIESKLNLTSGCNNEGSNPNLSSLVLWLITTLKVLNETGNININESNEINIPNMEINSVPSFSPKKLLNKCLNLAIFGDKNIASSALMLIDMVEEKYNVKEKLKKLIFLGSATISETKSMPLKNHDISIKKATEEFERLKKKNKNKNNNNNNDNNNNNHNNVWSVAESWIPCPIGMIPCLISSTPIVPNLDIVCNEIINLEDNKSIKENNEEIKINEHLKRPFCPNNEENEIERLVKKQKQVVLKENEVKFPMENVLFINGVWRKVSEDEFGSFKSRIRIFV